MPKYINPLAKNETRRKASSSHVRGRHVRNVESVSDTVRPRHAAAISENGRAQGVSGLKHPRPRKPIPRHTAQELYPAYVKKRTRNRMIKNFLLGTLAVFMTVVFVVGGYALWFSAALDNALSMSPEVDESVNAVLTVDEVGKPFYMLLIGSDSREGSGTSKNPAMQGDNQRSDVMILVRVDASKKQITMVSIPRDTPYELDDGSMVKINEAYNVGGAAASIGAVSKLTGVPISHYAEVHFSEFQELINKLGGIVVDVPIRVSYKDALTGEKVTIEPGVQTLDGQQAQIFARARHEYGDNQEAKRQSNIRQILMAIIDRVLEKPVTELPGTVLDLASSVGTDFHTSDLVSLALSFASGPGSMQIYSCTGPSEGAYREEYGGLWLCYENPEGWTRLMEVVDSGKDPNGLDVEETAIIPVSSDGGA